MTKAEKQNLLDMVASWAMRVKLEQGEVRFKQSLSVIQEANAVSVGPAKRHGLTFHRFAAMMVQVASGNDGYIHWQEDD